MAPGENECDTSALGLSSSCDSPGHLVKVQIMIHGSWKGRDLDSAFLTVSQLMLTLLV